MFLSPLKTRCSRCKWCHMPKFHLARHVTFRHDSTRSTCRASRAVLF